MGSINEILLKALASQEAYDEGIVPLDWATIQHDVSRLLDKLPPEESRKLRRKFRKMWRKLIVKNNKDNASDLIRCSLTAHSVGLGVVKPDLRNATARKHLVLSELMSRARKKATEVPM